MGGRVESSFWQKRGGTELRKTELRGLARQFNGDGDLYSNDTTCSHILLEDIVRYEEEEAPRESFHNIRAQWSHSPTI